MRTRARSGGFTITELVVVIAIMGVLFAVATPAFRDFMSGQRVRTLAVDLTTDLLLARNEALKRNTNVTVTPGAASDWTAGWTVTYTDATGTQTVSTRAALNDALTLSNAPASITFNASGRATAQMRMTVKPSTGGTGSAWRCVALDTSGRARSTVGGCSS